MFFMWLPVALAFAVFAGLAIAYYQALRRLSQVDVQYSEGADGEGFGWQSADSIPEADRLAGPVGRVRFRLVGSWHTRDAVPNRRG